MSHASKAMLKILQMRVQQLMNQETPGVQGGFRKGRGTRDQIANIRWIIKKAREFQKKHTLLLYWLHQTFDSVDHNILWKIQDMGISDHFTYLLRNLYASQEATVRTGHGTIHWFQTRKGVHQCYLLHCVYLTFIQSTLWEMLNWMKHKLESRLPGEISITCNMQMTPPYGRKWKGTLYRSSWWKWKDSEKAGLKLNIHNTKIMASGPISSVQFSHSVVSNSFRPHELQHARPPCPSPTPGVHSNSRPSSQWCHPAISSSVVPFSSCSQSLPASESFPMSQLFAWGGHIPHYFIANRCRNNGSSDGLYCLGLQNLCRWWLQPWN